MSFRSLRNTEGQVVVEHDPRPGLEESHRPLLIPITRPGSLRFLGCRIPVNIHGLPVSYRSPARIFLVSWAGGAITASYFGYRLISHTSCFFYSFDATQWRISNLQNPEGAWRGNQNRSCISKFSIFQGFLISAVSRVPLFFFAFSDLALLADCCCCFSSHGRYPHFLSDGSLCS